MGPKTGLHNDEAHPCDNTKERDGVQDRNRTGETNRVLSLFSRYRRKFENFHLKLKTGNQRSYIFHHTNQRTHRGRR
jgi:hypothetical protein